MPGPNFETRRVAAVVGMTAALLVAGFPSARAQERQPVSVAVIDVGRIVETSKAGKAAIAKLTQLKNQKDAEGSQMQEAAKALQTQINDGRLTLSEERLRELSDQFEEKVEELRVFQESANRTLAKEQQKELEAIEKKLMPLIDAVGRELGYTLIFNKFQSGLVFAVDEVDITDVVLARFDAAEPGS